MGDSSNRDKGLESRNLPHKTGFIFSVNIHIKSVQTMLLMTRTKNQKGPFIAFCINHAKAGYGMEKNPALLLAVQLKTLLITGAET